MRVHRQFLIGVGVLGASSASAQSAPLPPIRKLGPIVARTTVDIGDAQAVRVLSDGRVLVTSPRTRRLLLLDASLSTERDIAVPSAGSVPEYAPSNRILLAARGDTSFLLDGSSRIAVVDPGGGIARSIPLPPSRSLPDFLTPSVRATGDRQGRLLSIPPAPTFLLLVEGFIGDTVVSGPDSVPLLRFDPVTQRADTVAVIRGPRRRQAVMRRENGGRGISAQDPFPMIGDDWTVLADGTIAIARLSGYSIDWIAPNGSRISTPAIAHDWTTISASKKAAIIDSMRVVRGAAHADSLFPADSARYDSLALVAKANPEALTDTGGKRTSLGPRPMRLQFVQAADLPDSLPPFAPAGMVAGTDNNLWIQNYVPARAGGGIVYDVVNNKGVLVDRVELPQGTTLLALMPGYALVRVRDGGGVAIAKIPLR